MQSKTLRVTCTNIFIRSHEEIASLGQHWHKTLAVELLVHNNHDDAGTYVALVVSVI